MSQAPRKYYCPNCGQRTGMRILYGYPSSEDLDAEAAKTLVRSGNWNCGSMG